MLADSRKCLRHRRDPAIFRRELPQQLERVRAGEVQPDGFAEPWIELHRVALEAEEYSFGQSVVVSPALDAHEEVEFRFTLAARWDVRDRQSPSRAPKYDAPDLATWVELDARRWGQWRLADIATKSGFCVADPGVDQEEQ